MLGVLVWSPLAGGFLTGRYGPSLSGGRRTTFTFHLSIPGSRCPCIAGTRRGRGRTTTPLWRVALAWVLAPGVTWSSSGRAVWSSSTTISRLPISCSRLTRLRAARRTHRNRRRSTRGWWDPAMGIPSTLLRSTLLRRMRLGVVTGRTRRLPQVVRGVHQRHVGEGLGEVAEHPPAHRVVLLRHESDVVRQSGNRSNSASASARRPIIARLSASQNERGGTRPRPAGARRCRPASRTAPRSRR